MTMLAQEKDATEIAAALGRAVSTVPRKVHRHPGSNGVYSAISAQCQADRTARLHHTQRTLDDPVHWSFVEKMLKLRWSPEQIAHVLCEEYPEEPSMHVSHETIYDFLYVQGRGQFWFHDI
jgi:IS30 family transposase